MAKKMAIAVVLLISTMSLSSQRVNSFAMWLSGGYNNFLASRQDVAYVGNMGVALGLGYDLRLSGFLFQLGGELQHYTSNARLSNFTEIIPMKNTEGISYNGLFAFERNIDRQTMGNATAVLKLGFIASNDFYMLFGAKYGLNLYGSTTTFTNITSKGQYDHIIGEDEEGTLSDMPNHGYYSIRRSYSEMLDYEPSVYGSIEAGMQFSDNTFLGAIPRFAFVFDIGLTGLKNYPAVEGVSIIKDISTTEEFQPALRTFFFNPADSRITSMFAGVKFTLLWGSEQTSYCNCITDFKYRHPKRRKHR